MNMFKSSTAFLVLLGLLFLQSNVSNADFPPAGNEWIPAQEGDVRSPCPFINTLANHGFINRTGMNVDLFQMVEQLSVNFGVADTLFLTLAGGAISLNFTRADNDGTVRLNIDELFAHNKQEHDASFVRPDVFFGEEEAKVVDPMLLDKFINGLDSSSDVLTKTDIMVYQQMRIEDSLANNPEAVFTEGQTTSFSAQATLWLAFGQDSELAFVSKARLLEFLDLERFPDGYIPTVNASDYVDVIADGTLANDIRLEFVTSFQRTALGYTAPPSTSPAPTVDSYAASIHTQGVLVGMIVAMIYVMF